MIKNLQKRMIVFFSSGALCVGALTANCEKITEADIKDIQDLPLKPEEILAIPTEGKSAKGVLYKFTMWMKENLPCETSDKRDKRYQKGLAMLKAEYKKRGTVPFRFTADIEVKGPKDSKYKRYTKGDTWIYIINSEKKIIYKKKESNGKLCSS